MIQIPKGSGPSPQRAWLLCIFFLAAAARGQDAAPQPDLDSARQQFETQVKTLDAERQQKFDAAVAQYLAQLNALLNQDMTDRKLDDAIAVKREIERVQEFASADPAAIKAATVLDFSFDQSPLGSQIMDASGNNNTGALAGAVWISDGHHAGAFQFGLRDQAIVVPNSALLNPKEITLAAWIKTSTNDGKWRRIFDKSYQTSYAVSVGGITRKNDRRWQGKLIFEIGGLRTHACNSDMVVADGRWHYVVATFNGAVQRTYVDGKPNGRPLNWEGAVPSDNHDLVIGCTHYSDATENGQSFAGTIDEPMVFNRALTPNEIAALYASQK